MKEIVVITREELEEIIDNCFARYLPKLIEPAIQDEQKLVYSIRELSDFLYKDFLKNPIFKLTC